MSGKDKKTVNQNQEKTRFRHNPELSQWIYDKMDGGNKIYSKEDVLAIIADKLHDFVTSKVIDETALSEMVQHNKDFNGRSLEEWKRLLIENGYAVGSNPLMLSEEEATKITQQLSGFDIQQFYGIGIRYRKYYNGPIEFVDDVATNWKRMMTQEERWIAKYNDVVEFIETNHRNPSKHRIEEHDMLNWLKANRKALNAGTMKPERVERLRELLALTEQHRRKNQYE